MLIESDSEEQCIEVKIRRDLCRLSRFGANIVDAYSCFIFLPKNLLSKSSESTHNQNDLELAGFHSLSQDVLKRCRLTIGNGLIGWVAKHGRPIHVSPFERDSRTLGIYQSDQQLKSFLGIPLTLPDCTNIEAGCVGVIACDSKKSFAFSKLQGKLLEDLALEVSNTISLHIQRRGPDQNAQTWQDFLRDTIMLCESIGRDSLEIVRMRLKNFNELELALGTPDCLKLVQQTYRLIRQALPSQFPCLVLSNGDVILAVDNMTSSFYQNRINAICSRVGQQGEHPEFGFSARALRERRYRSTSIERIIAETTLPQEQKDQKQGVLYEFRRA